MTAAAWIQEAERHGRLALQALHPLLPPTRPDATGGRLGCASCTRIRDSLGRPFYSDTWTPGSILCRICGEWNAAHGKWPPVEILEMVRDGVRRTTTRVAQAMAAERERDKRKKRKAS